MCYANVVLCLSLYFIMALVPWLPHTFPGSWFIKHIVFERSIDGGWHIVYGTPSDSRSGLLEEFAWVLATQRQEKISVNN